MAEWVKDLTLLLLWQVAAVAWVWSLSPEFTCATGVAKNKNQKAKTETWVQFIGCQGQKWSLLSWEGVHNMLFFFFFQLPHPQHMEVPGPRIESKLQLHPMLQLWQCQIFNLLHQARNWTIPMQWPTVGFLTQCATTGTHHDMFLIVPIFTTSRWNHRASSVEFSFLAIFNKRLIYHIDWMQVSGRKSAYLNIFLM